MDRKLLWDTRYNELLLFIEEFGHSIIPAKYIAASGYPLGRWVNNTQRGAVLGTLSKEHKEQLDNTVGWTWRTRESRWNNCYSAVKTSLSDGYTLSPYTIPDNLISAEGVRIYTWVIRQREDKKNDLLSSERISLLEKLEGWSWSPMSERWETEYRVCKKEIESNSISPETLNFIERQRAHHRSNSLSRDRINQLEMIKGWDWNTLEGVWENWISEYKKYSKRTGGLPATQSYITEDGLKLGRWVGKQISKKRLGTLSDDRIKVLNALDGWVWDVNIFYAENPGSKSHLGWHLNRVFKDDCKYCLIEKAIKG